MADTNTTNYDWIKPENGASADTWGVKWNENADSIDGDLKAVSDVADAAAAKSANLSDLTDASAARDNLALGTAAICTASDPDGHSTLAGVGTSTTGQLVQFIADNGTIANAGTAANDVLTKSGNLSGIASASSARSNLALGNIATKAITVSTSSPSGTPGDGDLWLQYTP